MKDVIFNEERHEYSSDGVIYPSITFLLGYFGLRPDYERFGNDNSREFGKVVHAATALLDQDNLGDYDLKIDPWLHGYKKFLKVHQPRWIAIEKPFISFVWKFAGTPDRYGKFGKKNVIVEIKTGSSDDSHDLQTAAQQVLVEEFYKVEVQERYTLYLLPDDFRLVKHPNRFDKSVFLGSVQVYNWKKSRNLI